MPQQNIQLDKGALSMKVSEMQAKFAFERLMEKEREKMSILQDKFKDELQEIINAAIIKIKNTETQTILVDDKGKVVDVDGLLNEIKEVKQKPVYGGLFRSSGSSSSSSTTIVENETPSGTVNGSNVTFTIANTPATNSLKVYVGGVRMKAGSPGDYTLSGSTITFATAPDNGAIILCDYRY